MANALISKNDQVIWRRMIRAGVAVEIGSVVRLSDDGLQATVHFPTLNKMSVVPLSELQRTEEVFGGVRVQPSPARRTIQTYLS